MKFQPNDSEYNNAISLFLYLFRAKRSNPHNQTDLFTFSSNSIFHFHFHSQTSSFSSTQAMGAQKMKTLPPNPHSFETLFSSIQSPPQVKLKHCLFRSLPKFFQFLVSHISKLFSGFHQIDLTVPISKPCMDSLKHFVRRSRSAIQVALRLRSKSGTEVWAS